MAMEWSERRYHLAGSLGAALTGVLAERRWIATREASRIVTVSLLNVYSMRMAAVFTLTTVNIARHTRIVSRWLTLAGLACAVVLLIGIGISPWVELLFPVWILALSLEVLMARRRTLTQTAARPEG